MIIEKPCITFKCDELFSLGATLLSGQCFRWRQTDDGFDGIAFGKRVIISQNGRKLTVSGDDDEALWRSYLDIDTDYPAIQREITAAEPRLKNAAEKCGGLHILRQEPWEALCSFIISQNNNIPRIRLIIGRLCELCGVEAQGGGFAFPDAQTVAALTEEQLAAIGCGYRAGYIARASALVSSGEFQLERLNGMSVDEARTALLTLHGVGPKVADCMLLYGLHRLDALPRDVWIKRALEGEFKGTILVSSPYAGVAQQYIFEYIRTKN